MERSINNGASSNNHSAHGHHRSLSAKLPAGDVKTSNTTSTVTLFLRNIRLLNLDLLPDWPHVTPASLSQDARTRIRGAEWCLYHLFRLHDASLTSDKLQPFFPPLEPLQSINLRAALYRCLNELKKSGVLGKETVLRKSMLDDCAGDKFWELCLAFSAAMLRKVAVDKKNEAHGKPAAQRIASAQALSQRERDSMLPLSVAHRAALTKVLSEREKKRRTFGRLYDVLADKENDLYDRKMLFRERGRERTAPRHSAIVQEVLEKNWLGSEELKLALTEGTPSAGTDSLLTKSFDSVWQSNEENKLFTSARDDIGLLEDLDVRARRQKQQLQKWQTLHEKLLASRPPPSSKSSQSSTGSRTLRLDQHHNLTLRDVTEAPNPPKHHRRNDSAMKYDEILTAMREELRIKSAASPTKKHYEPEPDATPRPRPQSYYRRPSMTQDAPDTSPDPLHRSQSQTAVPVRGMMRQRMSSRSRSYQQPKIISQREIIPLKSEIFSPLKTNRSSMSPSSSGRMSGLASPIEEAHAGAQMDEALGTHHSRHNSDIDGLGMNSIGGPACAGSGNSTASSSRSGSGNVDSVIDMPGTAAAKTLLDAGPAGQDIDANGRMVRPSLADRTRLSMAFRSADDIPSAISMHHASAPAQADDLPASAEGELERRPTLHERTRQSISLAPPSAIKLTKRPSHARSRTSAFPVNQFETPPQHKTGPRRSTVTFTDIQPDGPDREENEQQQTAKRNFTPREKLFEEDAEYASIFKPRPKVALSPIASPQDASFGFGEDDALMESPSARR